uniref:hypothetical protein n=1 Tax=Candidatus Fimivicinus sp. TaxID=3056640 RepID=UPI003FEF616D
MIDVRAMAFALLLTAFVIKMEASNENGASALGKSRRAGIVFSAIFTKNPPAFTTKEGENRNIAPEG